MTIEFTFTNDPEPCTAHHWKIDPPDYENGSEYVQGRCKVCGETKVFQVGYGPKLIKGNIWRGTDEVPLEVQRQYKEAKPKKELHVLPTRRHGEKSVGTRELRP